jgi:hypothetical protein
MRRVLRIRQVQAMMKRLIAACFTLPGTENFSSTAKQFTDAQRVPKILEGKPQS